MDNTNNQQPAGDMTNQAPATMTDTTQAPVTSAPADMSTNPAPVATTPEPTNVGPEPVAEMAPNMDAATTTAVNDNPAQMAGESTAPAAVTTEEQTTAPAEQPVETPAA